MSSTTAREADSPAAVTSVIVVEDHALVRDSIVRALEAGGFEVAGAAASPAEADDLFVRVRPDLLMVDVQLGHDRDGLDVAHAARQRWPDLRVLVVSMHDDDATVRRALSIGVGGFVSKGAPLTEMLQAAETVAGGGSYLSSELASSVMSMIGNGRETDNGFQLTDREREVLERLAAGRRTSEIADDLFLSPRTVKNHLSNVYAKLGVASAAQAVSEAYRRGIVSPD